MKSQPLSWLPAIGTLRTMSATVAAVLAGLAPPPIQAADGAHGSASQEVVVDTVDGRPVVTTEFPQRGGDAGAWRLVEELRLGNVVDALGSELRRYAWQLYPGLFFPGEVPISKRVIAAGTDGSVFSVVSVRIREPVRELQRIEGRTDVHVVRSPVSEDYEMLPGDTLLIESRKLVETGPPADRATRGGSAISARWVRNEDPRFAWTVERGGMVWVAHRSGYRFDKVTFTGDTVRTVQVGDVPPPPAEESEFVPILAALAPSPEGWLWVQREEPETEGGSTWDVLDNCGRYRATVSAPRAKLYHTMVAVPQPFASTPPGRQSAGGCPALQEWSRW